MYTLIIGNKNYSSWSLRPWLALRVLDIPFTEQLQPFVDHGSHDKFRAFSPTGRVPLLVDGDTRVWDSLAIVEYVAEDHPRLWPSDKAARAFARAICAEMHSGFSALRDVCTMNCGVRVLLNTVTPALQADLDRIDEIWSQGLSEFGGPYLAGENFTAADAFYAPVALRLQTYGLTLSQPANEYAARLLALPALIEWYNAGTAETWREPGHEAEIHAAGTVTSDVRQTA
ncbi:glutathione S-transferase family protein [Devosia neptuniae]|jgi:glutathione S-transferase|uniref:glutathione S-transferase family protein n=1 Tax=Devosia TaxID=46913 RepID=UPI0022AFA5F2|nr:glutathione S-transferase family protein [Devosia neptuniae]MCZ4347198.1 glutathione S-transferase family protein [Devosia neptuniae]|tara:strand:+ start:5723 stop:6409 length:687 start_codon:yes stop_codon:yes gene_type:complete